MGIAGADAYRVAAEFSVAPAAVAASCRAITKHYGALVQTRVQANASGRPGPRAPTGQYRGSINTSYQGSNAFEAVATIGTNAVQGRRLELGFVGTDSIGRRFSQAPLPHFGPAIDKYAQEYVDAIEKAVQI